MAANFFPAHQTVAGPADFAGQAQSPKTEETYAAEFDTAKFWAPEH